jgi:hypothetical protein
VLFLCLELYMAIENEGATAVVEEQAAPAAEIAPQEKSMDDTIRETMQDLKARGAEIPAETPEAPEEKAQRIRDEQGKFAPKVDKPADETASTVEAYKPPNTWKKEAAEKLALADPVIRAEVERREADFFKGIEQYKGAAQFGQSMERVIAPHMRTLQGLGITPDVAVGELMNADAMLRFGTPQQKTAKLAELAQQYGIDIGQVQGLPPIDPNVSALANENRVLKQQMQQRQIQEQQQENATLNSEIAAFSADPKHSHFETVKGHMAALLQAGQAKDLPDAYEQAIYANPTTRAAVLAEQQAAARAEAAKKAQAAQEAASVNVRPRPSMPVSQPIGTMEDTIRAVLRRQQSA